ncbi:MAG: DnaA N-terminal domain-containing protein [Aggregatilineales bacterium]
MNIIELSGATLRVNTALAEEIGLNESVVLLQIEWWIRHSSNVRDDRQWTYQSLTDMREKAFPFWSTTTINRAIKNLIVRGLIVEANYNKHQYDRTRWFSLDCEAIEALGSVKLSTCKETERHMQVDKTPHASGQNATTIPETPHKESNKDNIIRFPIDSDNDDSKNASLKGIDSLKSQYGTDAVEQALAKAEQYGAKNPVGYARRVLENDKKLSGNPLFRSMGKSNPLPLTPSPLRNEGESKSVPDVTPPVAKSAEAVQWSAVLDQVAVHLDKPNYETWVRDCEIVSAEGGVWTVQAASAMARDMCQHRLYKIIREMAGRVVGAEVELRFVVSGEAVAS